MSSLLLISRDASTQSLAERALSSAGHNVVTVPSAHAAIRSTFNVGVDAALVDSAIGENELLEFRDWRRDTGGSYPVLLLAAAGARWLPDSPFAESGRDEVVHKPFNGKDLRDAVEKALHSAEATPPEVISIGDLALDRSSQELRGEGTTVQLTPTEFRLIHYLAQRRGNIVSSEELLQKVWDFFPGTGSSELVRSHVRNLRSKLRTVAPQEELVQTVPRRGYRLQ